ncbi:MAG: toll/interleukin-1 receptor domain-containing protein, partial [Lentisphaeria bacterium]|nr:toll/interleukin-1 receptor domain-containing protein [Lentisphaeria bacterium]
MNAQVKEYKYYAFISYSRKNSPAANYLQKKLERSKIPSAKVDESLLPQDGKHIKPVFLDKRDLEVSEKDFSENIKQSIRESRYLLVLCSVESAQSQWVNREISYFIETHGNSLEAVIPIILSGIPGSGDEQECLPEVLRREDIKRRNLPRMIPEKGETEEQGWENGLIQAMSYMLRVNRESIKATIDAERIRMLRNYAAIFLVALLIAIG